MLFPKLITHLHHLKIWNKLLLLLILPIGGVTSLSCYEIYNNWSEYQKMKQVFSFVTLSRDVDNIILNLQKERGLTAGQLNLDKNTFIKELPIQQKITNHAINNFQNNFKNLNTAFHTIIGQEFNVLQKRRQLEIKSSSSIPPILETYTSFIGKLIDITNPLKNENLFNDQKLFKLQNQAHHLLRFTEYLGQERASITYMLTNRFFPKHQYENWLSLIQKQSFERNLFLGYAYPGFIKTYKNYEKDNAFFIELLQIKDSLQHNPTLTMNTPTSVWFLTATEVIKDHKIFFNQINTELLSQTQISMCQRQLNLFFWIIFSLLGCSFTLVLTIIIIKDITCPINLIIKSLEQIGKNNLELIQSYPYRNEFQKLFDGINQMLVKLKSTQKIRLDQERFQTLEATIVSLNHEILNPLSIIIGRLESFKKDFPDDKRIKSMENAAEKINEIIKKISSIKDVSFENYTDDNLMLKIDKK